MISGSPVTVAWHILKLRMEERPPVWRAAANILTKQTRQIPPAWGFSKVLTTPHRKDWPCYKTDTYASGLDLSFHGI